jgi:aminoglycoside phosphotransferase (APT) family kinase protein
MCVPADRHRDPSVMADVAAIASAIFASHDVDVAATERARGWTNATWLGRAIVLRVSTEQGSDALLREADLAPLLPSEVGYPRIIETGVSDGYAWMLTERVDGDNLGALWPALDWHSRAVALRQLSERAKTVHRVDVASAARRVSTRSPFYAANAAEADSALRRIANHGLLSATQVAALRRSLGRFWPALSLAPPVLNHGDLSPENALWRDGRVVALLDFEYAIVAPVELDLNELLKAVFAPPEFADTLPDPGERGRRRLQDIALGIAGTELVHSGAADRLLGYAIVLEMWMLENRIAKEGFATIAESQPYRALSSLADANGDGGYLADVLAKLRPLA